MQDKIAQLEQRVSELEKLLTLFTAANENEFRSRILADAPLLASFDFTAPHSFEKLGWKLINAVRDENVLDKLAFRAEKAPVSSYYDPILENSALHLDVSGGVYADICCKSISFDRWRDYFQIYFKTSADNQYSQSKCIGQEYCSADMQHYRVKLPESIGILTGFRFDPMECAGTTALQSIVLRRASDDAPLISFDFTRPDTLKDWQFIHVEATHENGYLKLTGTPVMREGYDPILVSPPLSVGIDNADYVMLRCKGTPKSRGYNPCAQIYFTTADSPEYSQDKCVWVRYSPGKTADLCFDMSRNPHWHGTLTGLRADVLECDGVMEVEQIRILEKTPLGSSGKYLFELLRRVQNLENMQDNFGDIGDWEVIESRVEDFEVRLDELEDRLNSIG